MHIIFNTKYLNGVFCIINTMNEENELKIQKLSSFYFPNLNFLKEVRNAIEQISEDRIRKLVKITCCCGYRIGEILNSYLYQSPENEIYIRSIILKNYHARILGIKYVNKIKHETDFLGEQTLNSLHALHTNKTPLFKSNILKNLLKLDLSEIDDLISESVLQPRYLAQLLNIKTYSLAYHLLKTHMQPIPIKLKLSDFEDAVNDVGVPAFHFFRKLYATLYYHQTNNFVETVTEMRWKNLSVLLKYVKE